VLVERDGGGVPCSLRRRGELAIRGFVGWNQTMSPRLSKIIGPRAPGPDDGAMKT